MSKTYEIFKGKKIIKRALGSDRNRGQKKYNAKFMGWTSGSHSHGVYDHIFEDGKFVYTKSDRAPIKEEDYIKYGYPMQTQHKTVLSDKVIKNVMNIEINDCYENKD